MHNRPLIGFLIINFLLAIGLIVALNSKQNVTGPVFPAISNPVTPTKIVQSEPIASPVQPVAPVISQPLPLCMVYGPMNLDQKATFYSLLSQDSISQDAKFERKEQFEIDWSLGKDKNIANELFSKQKSGALQDEKFKLVSVDGNWIVPITTVNDSAQSAEKFANQLAEKANKVNAGGKWEYRKLPDAYFIEVKNVNALSAESVNEINNGMNINKKPCL